MLVGNISAALALAFIGSSLLYFSFKTRSAFLGGYTILFAATALVLAFVANTAMTVCALVGCMLGLIAGFDGRARTPRP